VASSNIPIDTTKGNDGLLCFCKCPMALPPRESVYGCIDRLITAREIAESAEVSGHSILSSDELASTIARLTDHITALELWAHESRQSRTAPNGDRLDTVTRCLRQLSGHIGVIGRVLDPPRSLTSAERNLGRQSLRDAIASVRSTIELLQTLPQYINPESREQQTLQTGIERSRGRQNHLQSYFVNRIRDLPASNRRDSFSYENWRTSATVAIGQLGWLWDELPRIPGLENGVDWPDRKDGIIIQDIHKDQARTVLGIFCDAWLEATGRVEDSPKFNGIRRMGTIVMILCVIRKPLYLDRFIHYGVDDSSLPFSQSMLRNIFPERNVSDADHFEAEQYRAVQRHWPSGTHIEISVDEPLPFRVLQTYPPGHYTSVDRVYDIFRDREYARKIRKDVYNAPQHMETEIARLKELWEDGRDHHIIRYVKTYQRGDEFGALFTPAATTNLMSLLSRYCQQATDRQQLKPALLRALGCLSYSLAYIHNDKETRHRDIKPHNILYHRTPQREEEFLWADFGLAKNFSQSGVSATVSTFEGTDEYAAPETLQHESHGRSADIFSLGCVFLEILGVILTATLNRNAQDSIRSFTPYHRNVRRLENWIDAQVREEQRRSDRSLIPLLKLSRKMIAQDAPLRPKISEVVRDLADVHATGATMFCSKCWPHLEESCRRQRRIMHRNHRVTWRHLKYYLHH
jgi:serine/threonine protein kinase